MNRERLIDSISDLYGVKPEYPWITQPTYAVFRHEDNRKWFAVLMELPLSALSLKGGGRADVLNVKCDPLLTGSLLMNKGFYPAYHMNKTLWISIRLDEAEDDGLVSFLIGQSFSLTLRKLPRK